MARNYEDVCMRNATYTPSTYFRLYFYDCKFLSPAVFIEWEETQRHSFSKHFQLGHASFHCTSAWLQGPKYVPFPSRRKEGEFVPIGPRTTRALNVLTKCPVECRPRNHQDWEYCWHPPTYDVDVAVVIFNSWYFMRVYQKECHKQRFSAFVHSRVMFIKLFSLGWLLLKNGDGIWQKWQSENGKPAR